MPFWSGQLTSSVPSCSAILPSYRERGRGCSRRGGAWRPLLAVAERERRVLLDQRCVVGGEPSLPAQVTDLEHENACGDCACEQDREHRDQPQQTGGDSDEEQDHGTREREDQTHERAADRGSA